MKHTVTLALTGLAVLACQGPAHADCIDEAATHHGVNPHVLRAIGWQESRLRPSAIGRNTNGTIDIGAFQINSIHLPTLSGFGLNAQSLHDGCISAYVAAWHYRKQVNEFGNTWRAVGAYHSRTPALSARYAQGVASILARWGVVPGMPSGAIERAPAAGSTHRLRPPPSQQLTVVYESDTALAPTDAGTAIAAMP